MINLSPLPARARIVLGSGSRFRRDMLTRAGLAFDVDPANVDEPAVRAAAERANPEIPPADVATLLAVAKAQDVSRRNPGALVIGSDQILALGESAGRAVIFAKPRDLTEAKRHIERLSGRTHTLHSAVAVVRDGTVLWQTDVPAHLTMRGLTPTEIEGYITSAGRPICDTVGAYMLEDIGVNLFDKIEGDYFTIIGLPLLPLLAALRALGQSPL
jgi:septum formation protein